MIRILLAVVAVSAVTLLSSCGNKDPKPPYNLEQRSRDCVTVPYEEIGGVKVIPVKLNGITMSMIYDTGNSSGVLISLNELQTLYKYGKISDADFEGSSYATIADGSIIQNAIVKIKEIEIGDSDDPIRLKEVEASVVPNMDAPLLLGNVVLDELRSVEIDNDGKVIKFYRR